MSTGVDPSGRAFRWKCGEEGKVQTAYAVLGCPPLDQDEITTWDNPSAFRPQICRKQVVSGDGGRCVLPTDLLSIAVTWRKLVEGSERSTHATNIVDAIRVPTRCPPSLCCDNIALAIPNLLREDAQDALLRELHVAGFPAPVLLWRPVALMLHWLSQLNGAANVADCIKKGRHVWVLDLDSAGVEITRLGCRLHTADKTWVAPVRSTVPAGISDAYRERAHFTQIAWSEIFQGVAQREQIRLTQQSAPVQKSLESQDSTFDVWVCDQLRWKRISVSKPRELIHTWEELTRLLAAVTDTPPVPKDIVLVHGWIARMYQDGVTKILETHWPGVIVHLMPADAVAQGCQLYAQRLHERKPTYYDTLPEYLIWCDTGWQALVPPNEEVEPGRPWQKTIDNTFSIARYRDSLSLLVQRNPPSNRDTDYARRLRVGLSEMQKHKVPLSINAEVRPAQGSARFTIRTTSDATPFVLDQQNRTNAVTLSYGLTPDDGAQGRETRPEPEHKGYLEAQSVIGRIYDDPANREMLELLCNCWTNEAPATTKKALGNLVRRYRTDLPEKTWDTLPDCTLDALDRWGWIKKHNPNNQPTRGLFGTRVISDRKVSNDATSLARCLWLNMPPPEQLRNRNDWAKRNNCCQCFASPDYKELIRTQLRTHDLTTSFSERFAPGYVLGENECDLALLTDFGIHGGFGTVEFHAPKYWWSFFRILCWYQGAMLQPNSVRQYLAAISDYIAAGHDDILKLPLNDWDRWERQSHFEALYGREFRYVSTQDEVKKNASFAILFALRVRETAPTCLIERDDLRCNIEAMFENGILSGIRFPPTMVANMVGVQGTFSDYVLRFVRNTDTVEDRELGSAIATMQ